MVGYWGTGVNANELWREWDATDPERRRIAFAVDVEEVSRKDLDSIDKKLNALVKRNKKLAQQALAS